MNRTLNWICIVVLLAGFVAAVEISNVQSEVTSTSMTVTWLTDEPGDSFLSFGVSKDLLQTIGDTALVTNHSLIVSGLQPSTNYVFSVESNGLIDDNGGSFYSASTLAPDTDAPALEVEIPALVAGLSFSLEGTSEEDAEVAVIVNGATQHQFVSAGSFSVEIRLEADQPNEVIVEATDRAGNVASVAGVVRSDRDRPKVVLENVSGIIADNKVRVKGVVSEPSTIEILVDERTVSTLEGQSIDAEVVLTEGENKIIVKATDEAGWETVKELSVISDTKPPTVRFELEGGSEYYEMRANTKVNGETEAGSTVYLYVFRSGVTERELDFDRALATVEAGEDGKFSFDEVSFPPPLLSSLANLGPKEVPVGLQEVVVAPISSLAADERKVYEVYVISEDVTGKTGYARKVVNVNSCFSSDHGFIVDSIPEFQSPLRLKPHMLEEGREQIGAVFNMTYNGDGVSRAAVGSSESQEAFRINGNIRVEKACTREQAATDDYSLGCQLLGSVRAHPSPDKTAFRLIGKLRPAKEFKDFDPAVWDDYKERRLKFPLKITVNYNEWDGTKWSEPKTQAFCEDVNYFVDVQADVQDLIPDYLANEGVEYLNDTINQINRFQPYLETAMQYAGIGCLGSIGAKTIARYIRVFMSKLEPLLDFTQDDETLKCPSGSAQQKLYLTSTLEDWDEQDVTPAARVTTLDKACPKTAAAWGFEAKLDYAFKFTCDRFLCRTVPAEWTADATETEVNAVLERELSCGSTAKGFSLKRYENCQETLKKDPSKNTEFEQIKHEVGSSSFPCFRDSDEDLWIARKNDQKQELEDKGIFRLTQIGNIFDPSKPRKPALLGYKPAGSETFMVAPDKTCQRTCEERGLKATGDGYDGKGTSGSGACFLEKEVDGKITLVGQNGKKIEANRARAELIRGDYTRECFIGDNGQKFQCVCEQVPKEEKKPSADARVARLDGNTKEEFVYRQDRLFAESGGKIGTQYRDWQYFEGRDWTGAFGLDYAFDNFVDDDDKEGHSATKVDSGDYWGSLQTMCLPKINSNIGMLKSTLVGMQKCLVDAKFNGFTDAGTCKTLFTNQVCGLVYKGISMAVDQCNPISVESISAGGEDPDVADFFKAGVSAIDETISGSIDEVNEQYGNAKFEEYFAAGAQGVTESLCLAALGYDFPYGMDLIGDLAHSASTKVDVQMFVANRELRTFDPLKGNAVYDYELAGTIWPGCEVTRYRTELKCIGGSETNQPGVDCSGDRCDCVRAESANQFSGDRSNLVQGGQGRDLPKGEMFDIPFPGTATITAPYRYDHVVITLDLNQYENAEACFDDEYVSGNTAKFYFPISDTSFDDPGTCEVRLETGKFVCKDLSNLFGGGQSYFEYPFIECLDDTSGEYVDCQTANLFMLTGENGQADEIVVKPVIQLGDQSACLQIRSGNEDLVPPVLLSANINDRFTPRISLGPVTQQMIQGGSGVGSIRTDASGDAGCGANSGQVRVISFPTHGNNIRETVVAFEYFVQPDGYRVRIPPGVQIVLEDGYSAPGNVLFKDGKQVLSLVEVNAAKFQYQGFVFSGILGAPTPKKDKPGTCAYKFIPPAGTGAAANVGSLPVQMRLVEPGAGGDCFGAKKLLARSSFGSPTASVNIRVQNKAVEAALAHNLHSLFQSGKYPNVVASARPIVLRADGSLDEALATYYWVASLVMQGGLTLGNEVRSLLDLFFLRDGVDGKAVAFPDTVKNSNEYQKVEKYLCCTARAFEADAKYPQCAGVACS